MVECDPIPNMGITNSESQIPRTSPLENISPNQSSVRSVLNEDHSISESGLMVFLVPGKQT